MDSSWEPEELGGVKVAQRYGPSFAVKPSVRRAPYGPLRTQGCTALSTNAGYPLLQWQTATCCLRWQDLKSPKLIMGESHQL